MSRNFGNVFQIAYVVEGIEKHIDYWTQVMGVGPFFHFPVPLPFEWVRADGQDLAVDAPVYKAVAVAYSGDMMIELIEPGPAPSTYRDFLEAGHKGVHHLGTFTDRLDEQLAAAKQAGMKVVLEGELPFSRFAYLEPEDALPGTIIEMIDARPAMLEALDKMKRAARDWDGKTRTAEM